MQLTLRNMLQFKWNYLHVTMNSSHVVCEDDVMKVVLSMSKYFMHFGPFLYPDVETLSRWTASSAYTTGKSVLLWADISSRIQVCLGLPIIKGDGL